MSAVGFACPRSSRIREPDIGPVSFAPVTGSYAVVGDWDADGVYSFGVKAAGRSIWVLSTSNDAPKQAFTFDFGNANTDLPRAWRSPRARSRPRRSAGTFSPCQALDLPVCSAGHGGARRRPDGEEAER